jgi:two-component system, LuxR family, response regulator FixJ
LAQPSPSPSRPQQIDPTVFIVDDDTKVAKSLRWLLESVGLRAETFSNAGEFLANLPKGRPGCLVVDVRMPSMSGLGLQEELTALGVTLPIIFITGHGSVQTAVRALQNGAIDFLEKPIDDQRLIDLVQRAIRLDAELRRQAAERAELATRHASLSAREREVLDHLIEGRTNKAIARELGLSSKTVEAYRANVMTKMGAGTLPQLVRMVLQLRPPVDRV